MANDEIGYVSVGVRADLDKLGADFSRGRAMSEQFAKTASANMAGVTASVTQASAAAGKLNASMTSATASATSASKTMAAGMAAVGKSSAAAGASSKQLAEGVGAVAPMATSAAEAMRRSAGAATELAGGLTAATVASRNMIAEMSRVGAVALSASVATQRMAAGMTAAGTAAAAAAVSMAPAARGVAGFVSSVTKSVRDYTGAMTVATAATDRFTGIFTGLGAAIIAAFSVRALNDYANAWTRVQRSLAASEQIFDISLTNASRLNDLANEARIDVEAYGKTYIRTAAAIRDYGYSSATAEVATSTLAKALKLGSAAASEQASVILQFSQALQKGKLDGDEFRSVMENAGVIQELLAKRLNVTKGEIVKLAAEGKLKLIDLVGAMVDGASEVDRIFAEMPTTVDEATAVLVNKAKEYIGVLNEQTGATKSLAGLIAGVANNLDLLAGVLGGVATLAIIKATTAMRGLTAAMLANPFGLIGVALATLVSLAITYKDETVKIGDTTVRVGDVINAVWETIKGALKIAFAYMSGLVKATYKFVTMDWSGAARAAQETAASIVDSAKQVRKAWSDITTPPSVDRFSFGKEIGPYVPNPKRAVEDQAGDIDKYERRAAAIKRQVAAMKIEAETYGMTEAAATRYRIAKELENAAIEAGIKLTPDQMKQAADLASAASAATAALEVQKFQESLQTVMEAEQQSYQRRLAALEEFRQAQLMTDEQFAEARSRLEQEHLQKQADVATETTNRMAGALDALADMIGTEGKKQFEMNKKLSIASATLKGYEAVVNSYNAGTAVGGPVLGAVWAGIAAATTAAQIAKIASTRYQGGGSVSASSGSSASASSTSSTNDTTGQQSQPKAISITLAGSGRYTREEVRNLIEGLNDAIADGARLVVSPS